MITMATSGWTWAAPCWPICSGSCSGAGGEGGRVGWLEWACCCGLGRFFAYTERSPLSKAVVHPIPPSCPARSRANWLAQNLAKFGQLFLQVTTPCSAVLQEAVKGCARVRAEVCGQGEGGEPHISHQ